MTDDEVRDVCRGLLDRARTRDEIARLHNGVLRSVFERNSGEAHAYRQAEELLRKAWQRSREAAK
jgi:hypothetical protein